MDFGITYWSIFIWIGVTGLIVAHNILRSIEKKHNEVMTGLENLETRINDMEKELVSLKMMNP